MSISKVSPLTVLSAVLFEPEQNKRLSRQQATGSVSHQLCSLLSRHQNAALTLSPYR